MCVWGIEDETNGLDFGGVGVARGATASPSRPFAVWCVCGNEDETDGLDFGGVGVARGAVAGPPCPFAVVLGPWLAPLAAAGIQGCLLKESGRLAAPWL